MNPLNYNDDDKPKFPQFIPNQNIENIGSRTQRSHTLTNNSTQDGLIQYQNLFPNKAKQAQINFFKRAHLQKGSNNEQNQEKNVPKYQNINIISNTTQQNGNNVKKQTNFSQTIFPLPPPQYQSNNSITSQAILPKIKILEIQQQQQFKKSHTLEVCSQCFQPKNADHQCNDEYGLINCPYCHEPIVRNFLDEHLVDCIPYIEYQFQNLDKKEECSICMEELGKDKKSLKCSHSFHGNCIDGWNKKSPDCPVCRKPI
ncbi:unnamed protein product (macronuclear) [Paramecium tetraurelia]|uniref:RING-type E3 ubiquitin transferase n=1 Tax=Paramecium tetraurelia TaxID=5888 RepID=A0E829_PARTE|nr:uncharacterized protein GSPATT00024174001 [Paramecium tetraurelia]CAK91446.1 unnamed protein product [Paramecium tetraurelia]|eukprot:XP_001458843.1 hypothetical protein (macronuclear) [Paramecium tetraurelia strain d4-2]